MEFSKAVWALVTHWNDGVEEEDIDLVDMIQGVAEDVALHQASSMAANNVNGKVFSREDDPRMRDAAALINPSEQIEEIEGLLDLLISTDTSRGRLPSGVYSFHCALNKGWGVFLKGQRGGKTHAVLDAWHENEYMVNAGIVDKMTKYWNTVLQAEGAQPVPAAVQEVLLTFSPILKILEAESKTASGSELWKSLEETKASLKKAEDEKKAAKRAAFLAKQAALQPGVNCCYECEEDDHSEEYSVSEDIGDLIFAKEEEGYKYKDPKPEKLLFCDVCYEDFKRY